MLRWLGDDDCHDPGSFGGKAANLSVLAAEHRVPPGFALSAEAASSIVDGNIPADLANQVVQAYNDLSRQRGEENLPVAVRSSALDEDGADASFAGQHDTYLNVRGPHKVLDAVLRCIRSASKPEAISYRLRQGLPVDRLHIGVLIQSLIPADVAAVAFSANPMNGRRNEVVINSSWGLGESIVGGTVTPDTFVVSSESWQVVSRNIARKNAMTVRSEEGTREVPVPRFLQDSPSLIDEQIVEMAKVAAQLERRMGWPADIECAVAQDEIYLLQCRPITRLAAT